jgi:hypothetical protein
MGISGKNSILINPDLTCFFNNQPTKNISPPGIEPGFKV